MTAARRRSNAAPPIAPPTIAPIGLEGAGVGRAERGVAVAEDDGEDVPLDCEDEDCGEFVEVVEDVGDEDADDEEAAEDVEDATELDAAELNPFAPAKIAAIAGFELRNPAVTSPTGHSP